jgi:hypothetical protein
MCAYAGVTRASIRLALELELLRITHCIGGGNAATASTCVFARVCLTPNA